MLDIENLEQLFHKVVNSDDWKELQEKFNNAAQPLYVVIDNQENIISEPIGYCSEEDYYNFLVKGSK